jgi:hypothetical protein
VSAVANLGAYTGATDLYTAIGCIACDNSLNFANISAAEAPLFGGVAPTSYTLYGVVAGTSFNGQDFVEVDGAFGLGTVVFPLAQNNKFDKDGQLKSITYYDTSWTNAGLITNDVVINPTGGGAPEPSTWLMGLIGFGLVGFLGLRRNRMSVA